MPDEDPLFTCPACGTKLRTPVAALGQTVFCSECKAPLRLPTSPDGQAVRVFGGAGKTYAVPPKVMIPLLGLLILGAAGVLVNGYFVYLFWSRPGSEKDVAMLYVHQLRWTTTDPADAARRDPKLSDAEKKAAIEKANAGQASDDDKLAEAWAPGFKRIAPWFTLLSFGEFLGGLAFLWKRWMPLAWLGCVCAICNVNQGCCFPGGIVAIWGAFVLISTEGRRYFGKPE
ncbi:MAG TPA: hypothetical protein VGJ05_17815 [Fimbriiglobus sp.]|jgi:hypothetical protein